MTAMTDIEKRAQALADARAHLADIVSTLQEGIQALHKQHMKSLKAAVAKVAERHDNLKGLIETYPELFTKPRTVVFHGIKLGMGKAKASIEWEDDKAVCKAIKKFHPEQADILISTTEKPSKDALKHLTASELKKLGVTANDAGDQVVIKPADEGVDKLVNALIKGATDEAEA